MAKVGAQRAAVLTGKSKSTIQRAMNSGKLSFELDQNKRRVIDVSELERVFGIKQQETKASEPKQADTREITDAVEKERMKMQIKMLEQQLQVSDERLSDLTSQRDKWEKQASQILITSQYSQKQAEELRAQIKEREDRARQRRLQNAQVQKAQAKPSTGSTMARPAGTGYEAKKLNEKMKKFKAENENAADYSNSVFKFWKRAKS
ncbi:MAG: entry exclusion 1 domain-containing protein [Alphaproteobacteria bacterium]